MADYLFGDLPIASAAPLPSVPAPDGRRTAPVLIVTGKRGPMRPRAIRTWRHQWRDDAGRIVLGVAVTRSGYLIRIPRQCDFAVSPDAARVDVRPHRHVATETLEHLLVDQILPRCLAHRGELVIHAAGIALGNRIALFVGESGRGKSTLASLFFRAGRTVLTDDCVLLRPTAEAVRAHATYPSLRLNPDSVAALFPGTDATASVPSYSAKRRFAVPDASADAAAAAARSVSAVYFLGEQNPERKDCSIEPLGPGTSCIRLMEQSFQLDVLDRDAVGRLLGRAGDVVTRVPAFALEFPRDFGRGAALVAQIEQHLARIADRSTTPRL